MLLLQQTKPPVCTRYFLSTLPAAAHTWDSTDDSAEHHAGADKQHPAHTQGCISTLVQYCSGFRVRKRNQQHILQTTDRIEIKDTGKITKGHQDICSSCSCIHNIPWHGKVQEHNCGGTTPTTPPHSRHIQKTWQQA